MSQGRSSSPPKPQRKVRSISRSLQADQDRYVMKMRAVEEREQRKKLEQEQYELELKKRQKRAIEGGQVFSG